jgi:hypothetical protein
MTVSSILLYISNISNQHVASSMAIKALRTVLPIGVFTVQGPTKSNCMIYQGVLLDSLMDNLSYFLSVVLCNFTVGISYNAAGHPLLNWDRS